MSLGNLTNRPKISVCIASYNGADGIQIQLQSVLKQLNLQDQVIISDDGSTDKTLQIIANFRDERIVVLSNNGRKGPVGNFENALKHATGDIIFLCDQDDIWLENKVDLHLKEHQQFDLVVSDAIVVDKNLTPIFKSFFHERKSRRGFWYNVMRNSYIGCCMSFNKKVLRQVLPFPIDIHMHDWWIGLVAEKTARITFFSEPLMYYIRHENNASGTLVKRLPLLSQIQNRLILIKNIFLLSK